MGSAASAAAVIRLLYEKAEVPWFIFNICSGGGVSGRGKIVGGLRASRQLRFVRFWR
jgi:hypothetical protein